MVKKVISLFLKPNTTSSNILFCPQRLKDTQFTVTEEEKKQKIFTFKKLEWRELLISRVFLSTFSQTPHSLNICRHQTVEQVPKKYLYSATPRWHNVKICKSGSFNHRLHGPLHLQLRQLCNSTVKQKSSKMEFLGTEIRLQTVTFQNSRNVDFCR